MGQYFSRNTSKEDEFYIDPESLDEVKREQPIVNKVGVVDKITKILVDITTVEPPPSQTESNKSYY